MRRIFALPTLHAGRPGPEKQRCDIEGFIQDQAEWLGIERVVGAEIAKRKMIAERKIFEQVYAGRILQGVRTGKADRNDKKQERPAI